MRRTFPARANPESVESFADALLSDVGDMEPSLRLDIDGCRIDVSCDRPALSARLRRYFRSWVTAEDARDAADFRIVALERPPVELDAPWTVKPPEPWKQRPKEAFVDLPDGRLVRKLRTDMLFAFNRDIHLAVGPCLAHDNQVVNFVNNRYMQWRLTQGYLLAHAGAVGRDGTCLAMCGASGAGKSTAALRLVTDGLDFVSNDRLLLRTAEDGVEALGIPKHPRVNPGTILFNEALGHMLGTRERNRLRALPDDALRALEDKYDVLVDEVVGAGRFRMRGRLAALVVFNWDDAAGEPRARDIDLAGRRDLLPLIMKSPGLFYEPPPGAENVDLSEARYIEVLSRRPVVEIIGRQDFDAAARLALGALERHAP